MQQYLRPHELAAARRNVPPPRPAPPSRPSSRLRFRDQGGWVRAAIVLIVSFFVVWLAGSAIMNELDGGKSGGDPWFNVPPFRQPDYTIPPPPPWIDDRLPPRQLPTRRGYGNGWRECRPGPNGGWDCAGPDRGWPW